MTSPRPQSIRMHRPVGRASGHWPSHIDFLPKRLLLAVAACCWPRLQAADLERLAV